MLSQPLEWTKSPQMAGIFTKVIQEDNSPQLLQGAFHQLLSKHFTKEARIIILIFQMGKQAQREEAACPGSPNKPLTESESEPRSSWPKSSFLFIRALSGP